jgi:hypothetical protein
LSRRWVKMAAALEKKLQVSIPHSQCCSPLTYLD